MNGPSKMDPADNGKQLLDIENKLWGDLDGMMDIREMLQAIAEFDTDLFSKPWLRAVPCAVELTAEVAELRRTLLNKLNSSNSQLAPSVQAHASAPALAHASVSVLDKPSASPFGEPAWPTKCPHQKRSVLSSVLALEPQLHCQLPSQRLLGLLR